MDLYFWRVILEGNSAYTYNFGGKPLGGKLCYWREFQIQIQKAEVEAKVSHLDMQPVGDNRGLLREIHVKLPTQEFELKMQGA